MLNYSKTKVRLLKQTGNHLFQNENLADEEQANGYGTSENR